MLAPAGRRTRSYPHSDELLLRASEYFRQAEFFLSPMIPAVVNLHQHGVNAAKVFWRISIPLERPFRSLMNAIFRSTAILRGRKSRDGKRPCLICMGGLDSIKDEMWFMQAHGALQRGMSVLMIDGPGQGGTLRRHGEKPVSTMRCQSADASTTSRPVMTSI